jgi:hypothetical protein
MRCELDRDPRMSQVNAAINALARLTGRPPRDIIKNESTAIERLRSQYRQIERDKREALEREKSHRQSSRDDR